MIDPGIFNPPKVIARKLGALFLAYLAIALLVGLIGGLLLGPVGNHGRAIRERKKQEREAPRPENPAAPSLPWFGGK